jgi:hypothetical protein
VTDGLCLKHDSPPGACPWCAEEAAVVAEAQLDVEEAVERILDRWRARTLTSDAVYGLLRSMVEFYRGKS